MAKGSPNTLLTRRRLLIAAAGAVALTLAAIAWWYFRPGGAFITPSIEQYPVRGIDISAHNGNVDFDTVAAQGYQFVYIKATEGTSFKDSRFHENYMSAKRAGLKVGAYHFFRFDASGYMQALNLLHSVRGKELDLPIAIDIEEWTNPTDRATPAIIAQLRVLIENLESAGYQVMLYSNKDGYDRFLRNSLDYYPLWIASLTSEPQPGWTIWQYTHRGRVAGVGTVADINTFNGSFEQWAEWLDASGPQPALSH